MAALASPPNNTLGAAFLGNIAAAILYGVTSVQTYLYYRRNGDNRLLKALVFTLWLLDGLHLAFITHALYVYTIIDFANPPALLKLIWSFGAHILVCAISELIVRSIFTYRIWKLSESSFKWALIVVIVVLVLLNFVGATYSAIESIRVDTVLEMTHYAWALYMAVGAAIVTDILIAGSQSVILVKRRTGFRRTDSLVRSLILYSISTGAFTTVCEVALIISYGLWPNCYIYLPVFFILPKLFLNALLVSLNAREKLREQLVGGDTLSIPLSAFNGADFRIRSVPEIESIPKSMSTETFPIPS